MIEILPGLIFCVFLQKFKLCFSKLLKASTICATHTMTYTCVVVDDDADAVSQLKEYISKIKYLKLVKSFTDPILALEKLNDKNAAIDFLFLDIRMPAMTGLQFVRLMNLRPLFLVLVTAYIEYASEGYSVRAKEFILKPFNFRKFEHVVDKLIEDYKEETPVIYVKMTPKQGALIQINVNTIIAAKASSHYVEIYTTENTLLPTIKFSKIEEELKPFHFMKMANRSCIVSTKHIQRIESFELTLKGNLKVKISKPYKSSFRRYLDSF